MSRFFKKGRVLLRLILSELGLRRYKRGLKLVLDTPNVQLPKHIAIIMDGNGRWANEQGLPRSFGHRAGVDNLREIVEGCSELGIEVLTLYAFSTENWNRPKEEVDALMTLLNEALIGEISHMHENNIKVVFIGRLIEFSSELYNMMLKGMELTKNNNGMIVNVALNYGGRSELVDSMRKIAEEVKRGRLEPSQITEENISNNLYTAGLVEPDLLIRTGGDMRVSNFLLWQIAYTEIWVTPKYWPAFGKKDLLEAVLDFSKRERRYGGVL